MTMDSVRSTPGLSDPRDFLAPVAAFEERSCTHRIVAKFAGALFESSMDHSPYNVVAWYVDLCGWEPHILGSFWKSILVVV